MHHMSGLECAHLPRRERSPTPERESDLGVVCAVQVAGCGFRAAHCRRGPGLSENAAAGACPVVRT
jgi:hypothetical protein